MKKIYTLLFTALTSFGAYSQVVISQVYGAGGNTGATFNRDFVELFNQGTTAVSLNGWSLQYNSATNTTNAWFSNPLPVTATIQPKSYYLVAFIVGTNGVALPVTPDFDYGITTAMPAPLALSGTTGRVALVNVATAQPAGCIAANLLVDFVAYGPTALCAEGGVATSTALTATTAVFRANSGCTDTNNNNADFSVATPLPRNSATAAVNCTLSNNTFNEIEGLSIYPVPVKGGKMFVNTANGNAVNVSLVNMLGKEVINSNTVNNSIDVSGIAAGVYLAKFTEQGKVSTRKIVIE